MKDFIVALFLIVVTGEVGGKGNSSKNEGDQPSQVYVRLKGSTLSYAGRVEISYDEKAWGTVCDKDWTRTDAGVICRQLDFRWAEAAVPMAGFSAGTGPIFLKDVKCTGSEGSLLNCKHDGWKRHDVNESCDHSMDVGVVCYPHKDVLTIIALITMPCLLAMSCLLNMWFICVCGKRKRKRKPHLTAVLQKTFSRRTGSQEGLDNLALDSERNTELSPNIRQNSPAILQNGIVSAPSEGDSAEDASTGGATDQRGQQQHVYQRLQSCVLDPASQEYLEILEPGPQTPPNQHAERQAVGKSTRAAGYQSLKPQGLENNKDHRKGEVDRYENLQLRNTFPDEAQASVVEQDVSNNWQRSEDIPDYVDIIEDGSLAANAMVTAAASETTDKNLYETLKPIPGSSHHVQGDSASSALAEDQHSVRDESQEEGNYLELVV